MENVEIDGKKFILLICSCSKKYENGGFTSKKRLSFIALLLLSLQKLSIQEKGLDMTRTTSLAMKRTCQEDNLIIYKFSLLASTLPLKL